MDASSILSDSESRGRSTAGLPGARSRLLRGLEVAMALVGGLSACKGEAPRATSTAALDDSPNESSATASASGPSAPPPTLRLSAAYRRTCATSPEGKLTCFGLALLGPRDRSDEPALDRYDLRGVSAVALGDGHACVVSDSKVACWGRSNGGQLGTKLPEHCLHGEPTNDCADRPRFLEGLPPIRTVANGHVHSCAIGIDLSLWCWGTSRHGSVAPPPMDRCGESDCVREPRRVREIGPVVQVALGNSFSCALETTGTVSCWGANGSGELGIGAADTADHERPTRIAGLDHVSAIAAGRAHACALREGHVHCWGANALGQIGVVTTASCGKKNQPCSPVPVEVGTLPPVTQLALSNDSSCVLANPSGAGSASGALYCWGNDDNRWLGVDPTTTCHRLEISVDTACVTRPARIPDLPPLASIANGGLHACGVTLDGRALCWGAWEEGQLGFQASHCRKGGPTGCAEPPGAPTGL